MLRGKTLKLTRVFVFAAKRLHHACPLKVLVVCACDLAVGAARYAELLQNPFAEFNRNDDHDRDDGQHDQRQPPVDDQHEDRGRW